MMQLEIFSFLSTLYLRFDYLWFCLRLWDINNICAKSNLHSPGFISLDFLADLGLTAPTLCWFSSILCNRGISASTVNPFTLPFHFAGHSTKGWSFMNILKNNTSRPRFVYFVNEELGYHLKILVLHLVV